MIAGWRVDDVQFQWRNWGAWNDFEQFLAALSSKKRKNLAPSANRSAAPASASGWFTATKPATRTSSPMHGFYLHDVQTEKGNRRR